MSSFTIKSTACFRKNNGFAHNSAERSLASRLGIRHQNNINNNTNMIGISISLLIVGGLEKENLGNTGTLLIS